MRGGLQRLALTLAAVLSLPGAATAQDANCDGADAMREHLATTQISPEIIDQIACPLAQSWRPRLSDEPRPAYRVITYPILRQEVRMDTLHWEADGWKLKREAISEHGGHRSETTANAPHSGISNALHRLTACKQEQVPGADGEWVESADGTLDRRYIPAVDGYTFVVFMTWDGERVCAHDEPSANKAAFDVIALVDAARGQSR